MMMRYLNQSRVAADWRKLPIIERLAKLCCLCLALSVAGCEKEAPVEIMSGDPEKGKVLIRDAGCGSCHAIPGVDSADGEVGPPLHKMARRVYLAGVIPNNFHKMVEWLQNPHGVVSETAMPATGLNKKEAEHVTAYLYTLK